MKRLVDHRLQVCKPFLNSYQVGYTIRFEDVSTKDFTRICYMTDGVLFREALIDPLLSRFSVIMVRMFHRVWVLTETLL